MALSALPSIWVGREPRTIAADFVDLLMGLLPLDFAFVRLYDSEGGAAVDVARGTGPAALLERLQHYLAAGRRLSYPEGVGAGDGVHGAPGMVFPLGVNAEFGLVAVASDRADFPSESEQLLLSVAAGHAATAFRMARLVEQHRRAETALTASERQLREARDELEAKVAERTSELQRSIQELQRSEFYLAEGQRLGHTGSWALNPSGVFEYWSQELFQIYGFDPQKGAPRLEQYLASIHPHDRDFMAETIKRMCEQGSGCDVKKRIIRPDGAVRYVRCVGVPVLDNGVLRMLLGTAMDVTEQEQLTQELQRREAYLAGAQRLSHTGSFGWKPDTGEIVWSDETYCIFEYDRSVKPTIDSIVQRVHPQDRADLQKVIADASRGATGFEHTYRLLLPDGRVKHVHAVARTLRDAGGSREFAGAVTDITERKTAEEDLRASQRNYRNLVDTTPAFIHTALPDGSLDFLSRGWLEYGGLPQTDLKDWRWTAAIHPEDVEGFVDKWRAALASGEPFAAESRVRRADGEYRWFLQRNVPLRDESGAIIKWYGTGIDIEERKAAEESLRSSEAYLAEAQKLSHTGSWAWSPDQDIKYWSEECYRVLSFDPQDGLPRLEEFFQRIHPDDRPGFRELTERAIRNKAKWEADYRIVHADGRVRDIHVVGHPVLNMSGDLVECMGTVIDVTERKRAEQALRQSEAYLADTQRLTHTGSCAYNYVKGEYRYCSAEHLRIYGLDPASGRLPDVEDIVSQIHPEDQDRMRDLIRSIIREKRPYTADYRIVLPDGAVKHLHSLGHPTLDERGGLVENVATVVDVTERTRVEQRLLAQNRITRIGFEESSLEEAVPKILRAVCESLGWHVGVLWGVHREAGVLRCAELWRRASVEIPEFEAATRSSTFRPGSGLAGGVWASARPAYISDVAREPQFDRAEVAAREGLHGAFAFPIMIGSEVLGVFEFASLDLWQGDEDLLDMMAGLGKQIGRFKQRVVAVNELQLRVNMLQHIPVAAWSVRPDGTPDIVNQLWFEYTGQTPEYVNSHPEAWMSTIHPEDRERASRIYREGIGSGQGFTMEARFLRASDGTYRWHLNRAVAVRDAEGNILRFVGTSTDVHDLRQVQEELRNTQAEFARMTRIVTMGELTASIAHEVNQPLGAMVTSAASCERWLASKPPQMEKARRALERIANDGRRAGAIIQRIRALMKRQATRKEWFHVNETILEVTALTQYEMDRNDIVLETRLTEGLPPIHGDKVQCQQVLLNLIVNAIEAMSEIAQRRRKLTIVSATDGPVAVRIEVCDSGPGFDTERATQLFEPFYTTKAEGLGIGLSISRSIVEAHGGRLTVGANSPHGAVLCIWLPLDEQAP